MTNLEKEYINIEKEKEIVDNQINTLLSESEDVKKFFELTSKQHMLRNKKNEIFKKIKFEEFDNCNHIWINILDENNTEKNYCGCVKCGLDKSVWYTHSPIRSEIEKRAMYEYLRSCYIKTGIETDIQCELDLGKTIYKEILETHPDIDDETASNYLKEAIKNIKEEKNSKILIYK